MDDLLQINDFEPHVGKIFQFKGTRHALPLDRIVSNRQPLPEGMKRRPFVLIFRGPKERDYLPEGIYDCGVEDGPSYRIYVSPIQTPEPDRQEYQAAFN
jgi:Domain of unknown function (DUF6916)